MTTETTPEPDPQTILDLPLQPGNGAGASTVRGYLAELLANLWRQQDLFSGKRPFGNSGWDCDLLVPLAKAGLIRGTFDEDGYLDDIDGEAGEALILAAIGALAGPAPAGGVLMAAERSQDVPVADDASRPVPSGLGHAQRRTGPVPDEAAGLREALRRHTHSFTDPGGAVLCGGCLRPAPCPDAALASGEPSP
jgi:hypothetical protein